MFGMDHISLAYLGPQLGHLPILANAQCVVDASNFVVETWPRLARHPHHSSHLGVVLALARLDGRNHREGLPRKTLEGS